MNDQPKESSTTAPSEEIQPKGRRPVLILLGILLLVLTVVGVYLSSRTPFDPGIPMNEQALRRDRDLFLQKLKSLPEGGLICTSRQSQRWPVDEGFQTLIGDFTIPATLKEFQATLAVSSMMSATSDWDFQKRGDQLVVLAPMPELQTIRLEAETARWVPENALSAEQKPLLLETLKEKIPFLVRESAEKTSTERKEDCRKAIVEFMNQLPLKAPKANLVVTFVDETLPEEGL